jgi:hypothetical protein
MKNPSWDNFIYPESEVSWKDPYHSASSWTNWNANKNKGHSLLHRALLIQEICMSKKMVREGKSVINAYLFWCITRTTRSIRDTGCNKFRITEVILIFKETLTV